MSKAGMKAARELGKRLPGFAGQTDAESSMLAERDELLDELALAAETTEMFAATYAPDSLKGLEAWYFDLLENEAFGDTGITRERMERAMAMYVGETAVRNNPEFEWVVEPYFLDPTKYEMGVRRRLFTWMLGSYGGLHLRKPNKRRQSIWREYKQRTRS